jgi:hypothetical protein
MTSSENLKFIQQLTQNSTTQKEKELVNSASELILGLIALPIYTTTIWAILTFIFSLSVPWLHVMGGYLLFNLVKGLIAKTFKK